MQKTVLDMNKLYVESAFELMENISFLGHNTFKTLHKRMNSTSALQSLSATVICSRLDLTHAALLVLHCTELRSAVLCVDFT